MEWFRQAFLDIMVGIMYQMTVMNFFLIYSGVGIKVSFHQYTNGLTKPINIMSLHEGNIYLKKREKYASQQARKLSAHFKYTTKSYNKICLVALQAPNVEPDWLLKAILASPRSILWLL